MDWFFSRLLACIALSVIGGLLAWIAAGSIPSGPLWIILGCSTGCAVGAGWDRWRGLRLLQWVHDRSHERAPQLPGFWAELAYRVEKLLRSQRDLLAEEQHKARDFLQAIEASPNGVMLLRDDYRIEWCNQVSADHFGVDPSRDRLQHLTHLVRDPDFVTYVHSGRFEHPIEMVRPRSRGTLSVVFRRYGQGLFLVLSQDITEREAMEAMRRDFVANVSHEVRTPLTVLAGFVETMTDLPLEDQERRRILELMGQQTQRMQALVSDLLNLAQLEGSPRPPVDQWHILSSVLNTAHADAVALSAKRHLIELGDPPQCSVSGDLKELHSALLNLLSNAVRYTPEGGTIRISSLVREDGCALLEVIDNGPGIAREHLPRLTERFYRTDVGRSRASGGTGLGLAIVKHVMQRHGGSVEIESQEGAGSTFRLVLPAYRVQYGAEQQESS